MDEGIEFERLLAFKNALESASDFSQVFESTLEFAHSFFAPQQTSIFLRRENDGRFLLETCSGWCPVDLPDRFTAEAHETSPERQAAAEALIVGKLVSQSGYTWLRAALPLVNSRRQTVVGLVVLDFSEARELDAPSLRMFAEQVCKAVLDVRTLEQLTTANAQATNLASLCEQDQTQCRRTAELAEALAREMGFSARESREIRVAALMKDCGYADYPERFWWKPAQLQPEEWRELKTHPKLSEARATQLGLPVRVCMAVRQHHEHFNGRGYPDGLSTESICAGARVIAVADAYVALTSERPYRPPCSGPTAVETISQQAGQQFDPRVVMCLPLAIIRAKCAVV